MPRLAFAATSAPAAWPCNVVTVNVTPEQIPSLIT